MAGLAKHRISTAPNPSSDRRASRNAPEAVFGHCLSVRTVTRLSSRWLTTPRCPGGLFTAIPAPTGTLPDLGIVAFVQAPSRATRRILARKTEVIRLYAKKAQKGLVIQNRAAEIKLLAERQAGIWIQKEGPKQGGDRKSKSHDRTLNLKNLNISRNESSRWQNVVSMLEGEA
ncbi:MAG: hypothetical protein HZB10_00385 [Candidatus Yonathbacteria bacterium]|nr:hypothetical protein [Candidatus Yonathbacteria bacterium]